MSEKTRAAKRLDDLLRTIPLIEGKVLARESELMTLKWPAYRFMSPLEVTQLFRTKFNEATRAYIKRNIDIDLAPNVTGVDPQIFARPSKHLTQLWIARQHADECRIRYEDYLAFAFGFAERRNRKWPPRPNQLRPTENSGRAWWGTFGEYLVGRVTLHLQSLCDVPQLRVANDQGLPAQRLARDLLVAEIRLHRQPRDRVEEAWVGPDGLLTEADVDRMFSPDARQAVQCAPQARPASDADYWQSCFGVGPAHGSAVCRGCPQAGHCRHVAEAVRKEVHRDTRQRGSALDAEAEAVGREG